MRNRQVFYLLLTGSLIFFLTPVLAQVQQPQRFEVELDKRDNPFDVINAGESGIFLYRSTTERDRGGYIWEFRMLNMDLDEVWQKKHLVKDDQQLLGYHAEPELIHLLYRDGYGAKDDFVINSYDVLTGDTATYRFINQVGMEITHFEIFFGKMILGGKINFRPVVMLYDFETGRGVPLQGLYNDHSELLQVQPDYKNRRLVVLMQERDRNKSYTISAKYYDPRGDMISEVKLKNRAKHSLLNGMAGFLQNGETLVMGTYGTRVSDYSRGLYLGRVDEGEQLSLDYFNYGELSNFFDYMKEKRQERIKRRIRRRKIKGKKLRFNYRVKLNTVIETDDQFILLGEAYYVRYSSQPSPRSTSALTGNLPANWRTNTFTNMMSFSGFQYTHAVIMGFDKAGNKLWDNSFEINDVELLNLDQLVNATVDDNRIVLLYLYENVIRSKLIEGNEVVEGKSFNDLRLKFEDDVAQKTDSELTGLNHWFDQNFYAYGVQKIKNMRDEGVKLNREVFFINKIRYE
ncbi:hypothetical protein AB9P05_03760 [Roseivirga sp. BDSF3-8]|uniref:hypothetical protein n=1 Tax=Roseivirga sp. BDSF3-8 TaxID=3241598 RepID=UPI0035318287